MPDQPEHTLQNDKIPVELKWKLDDDVPTVYANQLLLTHAGPEFYLIFGEVVPINSKNISKAPRELIVRQKVRIAISREIMPSFVDAINSNIESFLKKINAEVEKHDTDQNLE